MTRPAGKVALALLIALSPLAYADDDDAPAPHPGRHPVTVSEEPESPPPEEAPPPDVDADEGGQVVRLKHPKKKKKVEEDGGDAAPARAAPKHGSDEQQYGSRRIQLFLVPVGEASSLVAGPAQVALEAEVGRLPGFHPVDFVKELEAPPTTEEQAKLDEAARVISDGTKQLHQQAYDEAANRFRRALRTLEEAGNALDATTYAQAWTRLGIAQTLAGDEAAKESFASAARVDLANAVDGRQMDKKRGALLDTAREEVEKGPVGALSVVSSPSGARVFVGGVYRGTTPVTIDRAPAGVNFVKVDRPGAYPVVQLVDVKEARDTPVKLKLKFTSEALSLQETLTQVPTALGHEEGVPDMLKALGRRFRLERAVFATAEMAKSGVARVRLVVLDFPRDSRLIDEKHDFPLDGEGGLDTAIAAWARDVFDRADHSRSRAARDPLDRSDGTEDWYAGSGKEPPKKPDPNAEEWEKSNYKPESTHKAGVKSKDPLDHTDGTENW